MLLDGAMGTELIRRGLRLDQECAESWNLSRPAEVQSVHAAYAAAGAEVATTNTFGATAPRLARFGLLSSQGEIIRAAVELAKQGAAGRVIWGSLGPTGETLPLAGADLAAVEKAFAVAAGHLASAGVSAIHLETMFHPLELQAAIQGARRANLPVYASIALMPGASGLETPHGVPVARMLRALAEGSVDAVGVNCAIEAERMLPAVELLRRQFDLPIIAQPQAKISPKCATFESNESPASFARDASALAAAGAWAVGGCCGTRPEHIAALHQALHARPQGVHP